MPTYRQITPINTFVRTGDNKIALADLWEHNNFVGRFQIPANNNSITPERVGLSLGK